MTREFYARSLLLVARERIGKVLRFGVFQVGGVEASLNLSWLSKQA
jgi:hypothetical protein